MGRIIRNLVFISMALFISGQSAWGGWFSFKPNMVLLDGTAVGRYIEDIKAETDYLEKGDTAKVNQLISDEKIYLIKSGQDQTRVKFLDYEEDQGNIFIHVQDESGSKLWANIKGLACLDQDGKKRGVTKQDVLKGKFKPLP